jgi:hypothetical protein
MRQRRITEMLRGQVGRTGCGFGVVMLLTLACAGSTLAAGPRPALRITLTPIPSIFSPLHGTGPFYKDTYIVAVHNVGAAPTSGEITVSVALKGDDEVSEIFRSNVEGAEFPCTPAIETTPPPGTKAVSCTSSNVIPPNGWATIIVNLTVGSSAGGMVESEASASGGGAEPASMIVDTPVTATNSLPEFNVEDLAFDATGPAGEIDTQAGSHPDLLTVSAFIPSKFDPSIQQSIEPVDLLRRVVFYLPLGSLGDPLVAERCPITLLVGSNIEQSGCPNNSRIGAAAIWKENGGGGPAFPIANMIPENGYPAEFAINYLNIPIIMYASVVRRAGAYMLRVAIPSLPHSAGIIGFVAGFLGNVTQRVREGEGRESVRPIGSFLTNPSNCEAGPLNAAIEGDTWGGHTFSKSIESFPTGVTGCELLRFAPRMTSRPETTEADSPSGYEVDITIPQAPNEYPSLATPPLRNVSITLPEGTSISPAAADGLGACQATGTEGINIGEEHEGADGLSYLVAGRCPPSSQLGTVRANSPLLSEELEGHLFLAAPKCGAAGQPECTEADASNGDLFSFYLELEASKEGVNIKLPGRASVDPSTGRITATFEEAPQFPVSDITVKMFGGPRAPLANSQSCGPAVTTGEMLSWGGSSIANSADSFDVDWNGDGEACPAMAPFAPSFVAGTTRPLGGTYSPFTLTLARSDREQNVASITTELPEGLLASISKVAQCPEPTASRPDGECPGASQVGTTLVGVGSGSHPYYVTGKVYLTGPYDGAPFGLSVIVPAVAGPFNLGNVLVRVALFIDPHDARVTAVSGAFPQKIDGVPLRIRTVNVILNAPEFTFNPTNCSQQSIAATIVSGEGTAAHVASPFAAGGCRDLIFKPLLTASTDARSTKLNGTGVKVKLVYPSPGEANIAKVTIDFPKQLPVRQTTLRQACLAITFATNPASCPIGANIGTATVHTPLLAQSLTGPAYLVSNGSAQFPDVVFVLQGEGVTLDVEGQSFISNKGVLKVTFASVPDAPFSTFESTLPSGPHSQFTNAKTTSKSVVSQCGEKLIAPTTIVGQNGMEITQATKFTVEDCGKAKGRRKSREPQKRRRRQKSQKIRSKSEK